MNIPFIKNSVEWNEYYMHKHVYNLNIVDVPRIFLYDKKSKIMVMHKIHGSSISDFYGEDIKNVPENIINKIRIIIRKLKDNNIIYRDITGYNFILDENKKIWIIDFEHSSYEKDHNDEFVAEFCNGLTEWNPEFV